LDNQPMDYSRHSTYARYYASSFGWSILPVHGITEGGKCTCGEIHADPKDIGKHPSISAWQTSASTEDATIEGWWRRDPRFNVGVMARLSGFVVLDIDPRNDGFESFDKFEELVEGAIPKTVEAITGSYTMRGKTQRGRHLFYKVSADENLKGNLKAENLPGIDIKHNGYVLLNPSKHLSGAEYEWKPGHAPWETDMVEAPEELLKALRKSGKRSSGSAGSAGVYQNTTGWEFIDDLQWGGTKLDLERFQNEGIDEGSRAVDIYAMACALANKYGTDPMNRKYVETLMIRFNHEMVRPPLELEGPNSVMMHVNRALDFVAANPKTNMIEGGRETNEWRLKKQQESLELAKRAAQRMQEGATSSAEPEEEDNSYYSGGVSSAVFDGGSLVEAASNLDIPKDRDALTEGEGGIPGMRTLSDTGNGRRLVDLFGAAIRYTPGLGWFHWNGNYWRFDAENLETREVAKRLSPAIAAETIHYESDPDKQKEVIKWANQAKSNARLTAALESATSDPRVVVDVEHWDANPILFGAANCVINLQTGEPLKGRPDLHITRRAPAAYIPGAQNKRWQDFLDFGTDGDKEYQDWLQRAVGYTLTGLRSHDVLFLVYGPAGSGKNTLVEAFVKAMGSKQYAFPLDSSILAQDNGQASSTDLYHWAELRGRRMVWVDELPESERMKENSVKKLTGSSEISARSPGEKPFTFDSQAKLWITTNHRPIITDDAMWRRIRPIPWMNVSKTPDPGLKPYLFDPEGGLPAVLAWAVEGAMKLLNSTERDPLGWCSVVSDAAEIYRKNEDRIGMFLEEETNEVPGAATPIKPLFKVYEDWAKDRGERAMSQIAFQRKLTDRGIKITGQGGRAEVADRVISPRTPTSENIDWDLVNRMAR
jgi:P4 family phage/plasmid primase-like protien